MHSVRIPAAFSLLVAFAAACQETTPTGPNDASAVVSSELVSAIGQGAVLVPNCVAAKGDVIPAAAPVSATDMWLTDIEVLQSNCLTLPSGKRMLVAVSKILSDIPLPGKAVSVSLEDENGVPTIFNVIADGTLLVTTDIACGWIDNAAPFTTDCVIRTTPSGITSVTARFDN